MICWKIRIFAYWTTPATWHRISSFSLWFAEKFVSLLIEQHPQIFLLFCVPVVICWKIRIFAYWTTPCYECCTHLCKLWFAEKFVSLLIEQHPAEFTDFNTSRCDLLKNSYLCLLNNTDKALSDLRKEVVICWKIRIFAYWTTPILLIVPTLFPLWFAEKFVSLLIEQHLAGHEKREQGGCDLLKNSYLCLLNNTKWRDIAKHDYVVICWKIRIFAYWTTPPEHGEHVPEKLWFAEKFVSLLIEQHPVYEAELRIESCDLLKNSYLCLLNNTSGRTGTSMRVVVICWKIRIFAYWTTPLRRCSASSLKLWFAEKFVSLLIEQHLRLEMLARIRVVICWKIRIFAYWTTPNCDRQRHGQGLWFAEKFVSLLIEQHPIRSRMILKISCDLLKNSYLCLLNNTVP